MPTAAHAALTGGGMNTVNNLWDKVIEFKNVYRAYREAVRGKRYRKESLEFKYALEDNLCTIINELVWDMYQPSPLRQFWIIDPKKRLIAAPAFRDRIVHHALCQVIEPVFEKRFISESFACRVGRGTHAAMQHLVRCVRQAKRHWGRYYVLKGDVHQFFPSIHQNTLKQIIGRAIQDTKVLHLIGSIIRSYESPEQDGRGIPIGALTSQLFANVYLDQLDHYVKEVCPVHGRFCHTP
jgi:retron-type reverse transcriptase